jgi:hypothetical protein
MSEKRCGGPYKLYRRVVVVVDALVHIVYRNRFRVNALWTCMAQRRGAASMGKRRVEDAMHFALQHAVQVVLCARLSACALYMESIEHLLPSERRWLDGAAERVAGQAGTGGMQCTSC